MTEDQAESLIKVLREILYEQQLTNAVLQDVIRGISGFRTWEQS